MRVITLRPGEAPKFNDIPALLDTTEAVQHFCGGESAALLRRRYLRKPNRSQRNFRHHQRRDIARRHADIVHDPGNGHAPARAGRVLQALRP